MRNIGGVPYPITFIIQVQVAEDRLPEWEKLVQTDAEESRLEKGCLRYDVLEDAENPTNFTLYKVFKNKNAVADHCNTKH